MGKRTDLMDQFLLVGFGTSGKELKSNYTVKYVGDETVAGQKAQAGIDAERGRAPREIAEAGTLDRR